MGKILDAYLDVEELKEYSYQQLDCLAKEIRLLIIKRCVTVGGHLATNLGNVEMTMMLYRHFNPKKGYIIFDGAHQGYTHKILTDRKDVFLDKNKVGTPNMASESKYDYITFGHGGFGASALCGFARVSDKPCVLFMSDGVFGNGIEYEGLNQIATLKRNVVIAFNDNEHSIMENTGGQYEVLKTHGEIFKNFGFRYVCVDGYNLEELDNAYKWAFEQDRPTVVHVRTQKGHGYKYSELNPTKFHFADKGFDFLKGDIKYAEGKSMDLMDECINNLLNQNNNLYAMTVAMPDVGMGKKVMAHKHFINVGMTEEHAFVEACSMSLAGKYCIVGTYSTFAQRMYDCIANVGRFNDVNLTVLLYESGLRDNNFYQMGIYDIAICNQFNNVKMLCPVTMNDVAKMLEYTVGEKGIYFIRVPKNEMVGEVLFEDEKYKKINSGNNNKVSILSLGDMVEVGQDVAKANNADNYYCPCTKIDEDLLNSITSELIVVLENGIVNGGFGEKIAHYYEKTNKKVLCFGVEKFDFLNNPNDKSDDEIYSGTCFDVDYINLCIKEMKL